MTVGADVPFMAGYVFRGIVQEFEPKFTVQPFYDLSAMVGDRLTVHLGTWNSLHTGSLQQNIGTFYESDLYASASLKAGRWTPGARYTLYLSPAGGYDLAGTDGSIGISEITFFTSFDDRGSWLPLSPHVAIAMEMTDTQADFGSKRGTYAQVGLRPTFTLARWNVTVAVPATAGFSASHYYERFDALAYRDSAFGYGRVGAEASVPITWLTSGTWEAHAGLHVYLFGSDRKVQQANDKTPTAVKPVLNIGFSAAF